MNRSISPLIAVTLGVVLWMPVITWAQVNSGSSGSDGALNPTATNTVINMADHPTGIYQYTSVNIPSYVTVTFIPNANNTPVVWLVQSNVVINGTVDVSGRSVPYGQSQGGLGGPSGWAGGIGGMQGTGGSGPGGGAVSTNGNGGGGQYNYGNAFLIPLLGGSGGAGGTWCGSAGGGGGGGAILIAASTTIIVNGNINANGGGGGDGYCGPNDGGGGSGGAVRLVASQIVGSGWIHSSGAYNGGNGLIRFDTYQNSYAGGIAGTFSQGSQFVIIPVAGQLPQLTVTSVGGVPVSASPTGVLSTPDSVLSAQQNNPIPIVVSCANLPLNTQITVSVKPANGSPVSATGYNTTGTQASSTATISINIPRGGGLIYATAATTP